jgi:acetolactate synthase-1/2/3 large subunit
VKEKPKKFAEEFADLLVDLGFTHCFFVAGGNIMHLLDAARTRFRCVPVVHEVTAGIAAEYFNESETGKRAFALVTAGPGVTNIITAMSGAWLESRELLVVAGQVKSSDLATGGIRQRGIQEVDGVGLTRATTKNSLVVNERIPIRRLGEIVRKSWSGRPGPIFMEFCLDVQAAPPLDETYVPFEVLAETRVSDTDLTEVINAITHSERPLLLIGGGVSRSARSHMTSQLEHLGLPTMTTWNAADRIDSTSPVYVGRPNTWGQRAANLLTAQADTILCVGTRLGLQQTGFNWQQFGHQSKIIQVDIDENELKKGHPRVDRGIPAEADDFLTRFLWGLDHHGPKPDWRSWLSYCQEVRGLLPLVPLENSTGAGYIDPYRFVDDLSKLAGEHEVIIPCSSGGANSVTMQVFSAKRGQTIISNKGLASMGYGLAGAIGASFAQPGRRVFLIEGDGGFCQNLQDLATVAVNNLPIKMFLFSNEGYGSIRATQRNYFGGAYLGCDTQTGLGFPDWTMLFRSFGISSIRLDAQWTTKSMISDALDSSDPVGFIVPIDPNQTYWPKITSRILPDGSMESRPLHSMSPDLPPDLEVQVTRFLKP